jgi:hypothetical protein
MSPSSSSPASLAAICCSFYRMMIIFQKSRPLETVARVISNNCHPRAIKKDVWPGYYEFMIITLIFEVNNQT